MLNLFGKQEDEDYATLEQGEEERTDGRVLLHIERLSDFSDSDRIQQRLRDGHLMIVKIRDLRQKDAVELKRAVAKIRKTCLALNGDIAGLGDDWIIVTPPTARIDRQQVQE